MTVLMCSVCACVFVAVVCCEHSVNLMHFVFSSYRHTIRVSGPPVEVGVTMYVLSISSLSEVKMVQTHNMTPFCTLTTPSARRGRASRLSISPDLPTSSSSPFSTPKIITFHYHHHHHQQPVSLSHKITLTLFTHSFIYSFVTNGTSLTA
uniref:Putative secreted protein n=1 Tax=Anopheles marajoara TaxID=58244 RepID=A0A2M4C6D3_9DIPT